MERLERDAAEPLRRAHARPPGSIFRTFDALMSVRKYQDALGYVLDRSRKYHYRSMTDMVLCELFPEYEEACLSYYASKDNPQLKDIWSAEEARRVESAMLCLLGLALIVREDNPGDEPCPVRWTTLLKTVRDFFSQAPVPPSPPPQ